MMREEKSCLIMVYAFRFRMDSLTVGTRIELNYRGYFVKSDKIALNENKCLRSIKFLNAMIVIFAEMTLDSSRRFNNVG